MCVCHVVMLRIPIKHDKSSTLVLVSPEAVIGVELDELQVETRFQGITIGDTWIPRSKTWGDGMGLTNIWDGTPGTN